jgi:signal transduction histidine kinase
MVHTISMCSELLLVLINNILDIFKLEEKQVVLEKLEISPLECAEKSIDIVTVPANDKRIDVVLDFDEDVPQLITGDSYLLPLFLIALSTFIRFSPHFLLYR